MKRQFNHTSPATTPATATVAMPGGVEVAAKVYRGEEKVLCKVGAVSIEGIGFPDPPLGIAVKVHDGNRRAHGALCVAVVKQLGPVKDINDFPHFMRSQESLPDCTNVPVTKGFVTAHEGKVDSMPDLRLFPYAHLGLDYRRRRVKRVTQQNLFVVC
jgi:hypothetical protein